MEIVTEPEIRTAEQARKYAEELQLLLRAIGASDADMERGQMRVEANVSLRLRGEEPFGTRVEVKNMNSFRAVERAIAFEIERQAAALDAGDPLTMETRGWDDGRQSTYHMRAKETSDDYRYFPEPDLPPLHVEPAWIASVRAGVPELPAARRARYEGIGPHALRRGGDRRRPGNDRRLRRDRGRRARRLPAKEVANFVSGPHAAGCEGGRPQRRGDRRRLDARRDRGAARRRSSTDASRARRAASCSPATSPTARRPTSCWPPRAPARSRTTPRCSVTSTR